MNENLSWSGQGIYMAVVAGRRVTKSHHIVQQHRNNYTELFVINIKYILSQPDGSNSVTKAITQ